MEVKQTKASLQKQSIGSKIGCVICICILAGLVYGFCRETGIINPDRDHLEHVLEEWADAKNINLPQKMDSCRILDKVELQDDQLIVSYTVHTPLTTATEEDLKKQMRKQIFQPTYYWLNSYLDGASPDDPKKNTWPTTSLYLLHKTLTLVYTLQPSGKILSYTYSNDEIRDAYDYWVNLETSYRDSIMTTMTP